MIAIRDYRKGTRRILRSVGLALALAGGVAAQAGSVIDGSAATGPLASLSPSTVHFGYVRPGDSTAGQDVTLSNSGDSPLSITGVSISPDFTLVDHCGSSVAAGASCTYAVAFHPSTPGSRTGTFRVTDNAPGGSQSVSLSAAQTDGYNILSESGGIYSFGTAAYSGNLIDHNYPGPAVSLSETADGGGYAILTASGGIYTFGNAGYFGNLIDHRYPGRAVAVSYTPTAQGYSILTDAGALYSFGDARYFGNLIDHHYPGPAVSFAFTPGGNGYSIVTSFGGIYSFGNATYYGNLIDHGYPGRPVSLGYAKSGAGYNILTSSGTLYSFGDMPYFGNLVDHGYPGPATAISATGVPGAPDPPPPACLTDTPQNPYGYDFCSPGSVIYSPPSDFCSFFNCIASFWMQTNGYVDQCNDGMFSHSGGVRGACSSHGGERRALYSH